MSRKRCRRRIVVPLPPRGLRPRLDGGQLLDLSLAHNGNLDTIARGDADVDVLWQYVGGVFTWSRVAELMDLGVDEMTEQLQVAHRLVERWHRTGRVRFDGRDYQLARDGVVVMDQLAAAVDRPTAVAAAEWAERLLDATQAAAERRRHGPQVAPAGEHPPVTLQMSTETPPPAGIGSSEGLGPN